MKTKQKIIPLNTSKKDEGPNFKKQKFVSRYSLNRTKNSKI